MSWVKADEVGTTLHLLKEEFLYEFLWAELPDPRIMAFQPC